MKKIFFCLAAFAAVTVSCTRETQLPDVPAEGIIHIKIDHGGPGSRAGTPDTSFQDYETAVQKVDILVFNEQGQLNLFYPAETKTEDIRLSVPSGQKEIWAVINGPDLRSVVRESDLKDVLTMLEDNDVTGAGFMMAGNASHTVMPSSEGSECTITVRRFAARVALTRLSVNLASPAYHEVLVKNVMLINVVANQNLAGSADPQDWYNKKGLTDSGDIIDGSRGREAECPELTFCEVGETVVDKASLQLDTPLYFYGYPNPTVIDSYGPDGSFIEEQTRLVVTAEIDGLTTYYPVTLPSFLRNTAYEVELTIEGFGTSGPDILPEKGVVNASITIKEWEEGAVITEAI